MRRGYSSIGLCLPKNIDNVGSVLRAAGCYEVKMVAVEGGRLKSRLDTQKAWKHIPTFLVDDVMSHQPFGSLAVAVDIVEGAHSLTKFVHPERAFYVFGPEDGTIPEGVLDKCPLRVMVPTKFCMNLAACVNVVLYDRMLKDERK